jgi:hypothetical protein
MTGPRLIVMEAIATKRLVEAVYNGATTRLAPHVLFERHGDLFLSALNVDKAWRSGESPRLGQFKLSGLADCRLTADSFDPLPTYVVATPKADDELVLAV